MDNRLVGNWYFVYIPIHIVIGAISWAWFYYSDTELIKEEFRVVAFGFPIQYRLIGLIFSVIFGPFTFLSIILDHFSGKRKLRRGLRFY